MPEISNLHDKFFKDTFSQLAIARDFIEQYVPSEIVAALDLTTLTLQKDSFVDETLQEYFSDILYDVELRQGGASAVYFLFEHKSYPDKWSALQLLGYMVQIWERALKKARKDGGRNRPIKLSPIIPLLVYHGEKRWQIDPQFAALFDIPTGFERYFPNFQFQLTDLSEASAQTIRGLETTQFVLQVMRYIRSDQLRTQLVYLLHLAQSATDSTLIEHLIYVSIRYMMHQRDDLTFEDYQRAITQARLPQGDAVMATLAQQLISEGVQIGWQGGRQEGIRGSILNLLQLRFQVVPSNVDRRLATIDDIQTLNQLLESAALAASMDTFTNKLRRLTH